MPSLQFRGRNCLGNVVPFAVAVHFICVLFLETRKLVWMGPQKVFQAIFFLQRRVNFSPVMFARCVFKTLDAWDPTVYPNTWYWCFFPVQPPSLPDCSWAIQLLVMSIEKNAVPSSSWQPFFVCKAHYFVCLFCVTFSLVTRVRIHQWESPDKPKQMLTLQFFVFPLSLIPFHALLLKCRSTSNHKRERSIFHNQEIKGIERDNTLQIWKDLEIPLQLYLEKCQWQGKIIFINSVRTSVGCKFCLTWKTAFSSWISTSKIISRESKILCHT